MMKPKRFFDYRFSVGIIGILGLGGVYGFCLYMMRYLIEGYQQKSIELSLLISILLIYLIMGVGIVWFIWFLSDRTLAWLTVTKNNIIWRCPFHITVRMNLLDCVYVGVEDMADHNKIMPIIRGDEISYIYFSKTPFLSQYRHKIDKAKCRKNFIKFAYSDKLCQHLIKIFPREQIRILVSFHNRMQVQDRILKQSKRKK